MGEAVPPEDVIEWKVESDPKPMEFSAIQAQLKFLMGKVLTVVDATYQDKEQKKAVKDLIKDSFSGQLNWIYELCGYPEVNNDNSKEELKAEKSGSSTTGKYR